MKKMTEDKGDFLGPAASKAGRRYAAGLTGLFGPAAACGGFGLALRPPLRSAGPFGLRPRRLRRLLQIGYSLWPSNCSLKGLLWAAGLLAAFAIIGWPNSSLKLIMLKNLMAQKGSKP
ncbi:hypothetical protein PPO43_05040 [Saprospira sp. CCB-QB6]|uniref:hypothetical protein n=1 Tax=Saprospira sp. CCB-QB6 TaxID=3023936 RepID=UPI00234AE5B7|nr:hypothetical protein [Saprospira sp. CCB-QB6]WCL82464.1 hypothetical protein PPO43_05040 [Saprospira sp. CCB-QB6]